MSVPSLLGAEHAGFLLRLADEQDALIPLKSRQVFVGDVVFALSLFEGHQVESLGLDEPLDRLDESLAHRGDHGRRRNGRPELGLHEVDETAARLQRRDVGIEIHPVDGFQLEGHDWRGSQRRFCVP